MRLRILITSFLGRTHHYRGEYERAVGLATDNLAALPAYANVKPLSLVGTAGFIELIGGALLILGLFTRPAAFILSGEMAVAYFMVHAPRSFYPLVNGGTLAIIYCFACLYLSSAGGGRWSIDAAIGKRDRSDDREYAAFDRAAE